MGRPGLSLDKKFRRLAHDLDDFQAGFGRVLARGVLELIWDTAYEACTDELGDALVAAYDATFPRRLPR